MEIFYLENRKYVARCPKCSEIVRFKINYENFTVSVECKNNHNKEDLSYDNFEENYIKSTHKYYGNCQYCYNLINDNCPNYKCQICNKVFCPNCVNNHIKEKNHYFTIKFEQQYKICDKHYENYTFLCKNCKTYICYKCKSSHKNHSFESIIDIIPNQAKLNSIKTIYDNYSKKINDLSLKLTDFKSEIDRRFREIVGFLQFLIHVNDNLLINFNYNYYNYYNYENFNYLFKLINNNSNFDFEKYKNYLLKRQDKDNKVNKEKEEDTDKGEKSIGKSKKEILKENRFLRREKDKDYNFIKNLNDLEYLKDNIFYVFDKLFIKFFQLDNFSFTPILQYELGKFKIHSIEPSKYYNRILLNFEFKKSVKILKYDLENKIIKILKKDIKAQRIGYPRHFYKCIDNKNGNILTQDNIGCTIWKKNEVSYIKYKTINNANISLQNINESLFCFQDNNYNLQFYDTDTYECNKLLTFLLN